MANKKLSVANKPKFEFQPEAFDNNSASLASQKTSLGSFDGFGDPYSDSSGSFTFIDYTKYNNLINRSYPLQKRGGYIYIRQAIILCQTAWIYIPVFYQTVECMVTLANTGLEWIGGSEDGKKFGKVWWNKIGGENLSEQSFRELCLSSNLFLYRYDGGVKKNKLNKFILSSEVNESEAANTIKIPVKYVVVNPADVCLNELTQYSDGITPTYFRFVDVSTLNKLKSLEKNDSIELPESLQELMKTGAQVEPLNPENLSVVFYRKQDYLPFAIPMGFSVLEDINLKMELKKADACVAKTIESIVTLVKHGATDKDGNTVMNPLVDTALKQIFNGNQKSKTIVADSTTSIEFAIPDIQKVIGKEKYDKLDQDINDGLFNIFFGEQQFATMAIKLRVFVKILTNLQNIFLNQFLKAEVKRVFKAVGYQDKDIPTPKFRRIDLEDPSSMAKIYTQFATLGLLTPDETFFATETGILPSKDEAIVNQQEYKKHRKNDLFMPMIGGNQKEEGGRPVGSKKKKTKTKVTPKGASIGSEINSELPELPENVFDVLKFKENILLANNVTNKFESEYKLINKKNKLSKQDREEVKIKIIHLIINNKPDEWESNISNYCSILPDPNFENIAKIEEIKSNNSKLDDFTAGVLLWSR